MFHFKKFFSFFSKNNIPFFLFFLFFIFSLILIFKLYELQIIKGEYYNEKVLNKIEKITNKDDTKRRGVIYFKNENGEKVAVALQKFKYILKIDPNLIKDKDEFYFKINQIKEINRDFFNKQISKKSRGVVLYDDLSYEDVKSFRKSGIKKLFFYKKPYRFYPFSETSSKIIGFVNYNFEGSYGLEKYYNEVLKRSELSNENVFLNLFVKKEKNGDFGKKRIFKEGDLIGNIDIGLSVFLEERLKEIDKKYKSKYSGGLIIHSKTGKIIAMSDSKGFDLNNDRKDYRNPFIEYRFEVGSVFKPLVVAIALEKKKIGYSFQYEDKGCVKVLNKNICNFDKKSRGKGVDLEKILTKSLNTGMVEIGKRIGQREFYEFLLKLSLDRESGIDLPGEISSSISSLNEFNEVNFATATFGQGIAFTPVAISRALNSLSNGGILITPHIIEEIKYGEMIPGTVYDYNQNIRVFTKEVADFVTKLLVKRAD